MLKQYFRAESGYFDEYCLSHISGSIRDFSMKAENYESRLLINTHSLEIYSVTSSTTEFDPTRLKKPQTAPFDSDRATVVTVFEWFIQSKNNGALIITRATSTL